MIIPSMLYGCEIWGDIPKKEMTSLEVVQTRVGKHIQGLHRRTHNEIVRGLLGWIRISGTIDLCKLNFVYKLMSLPHDNIIKYIFLCQMYALFFSPSNINSKSITYNLWSLLNQYNLTEIVVSYLAGGALDNKFLWKQIIKKSVRDKEEQAWNDDLLHKEAFRFNNVHRKLEPSYLYNVMKRYMYLKKKLMNVVKLLAYPEHSEECICELCGITYSDTVEHYLMRCQGLIRIRSDLWDNILDSVSCYEEVLFLQKDDQEMLHILLSGEHNVFENFENSKEKQNDFICKIASSLDNLMYVI